MPNGPHHYTEANRLLGRAHHYTYGDGADPVTGNALATEAVAHALQGLTAAVVMLTEAQPDNLYELDGWREVIPRAPLPTCRSKEARRSECTERHTEDCDYADPPPEPKHELLPIGTRVLVSEGMIKYPDGRVVYDKQPKAAKIVGYDMPRSKYQLNGEKFGGGYYDFVTWAFADNRVQPHPEQDTAVAEPTAPRIYVQTENGQQGYVLGPGTAGGPGRLDVAWFEPGQPHSYPLVKALTFITADDLDRCPNGQTGDECGSGENQCEPCLADEDEEAAEIEQSMGLRDNPHSPGCPPINHRH